MHVVVLPTMITLTNSPNQPKLKRMSRARTLGTLLAAAVAFASPSTRAEEPEYQLVGSVEPKLVSLSILPRPGYRLSTEAPLVVRLDGDGVTLPRKLYRREDAVDPRAEAPRFEIAFRKTAAASARLDAELIFYVCQAARCRPVVTRWSSPL